MDFYLRFRYVKVRQVPYLADSPTIDQRLLHQYYQNNPFMLTFALDYMDIFTEGVNMTRTCNEMVINYDTGALYHPAQFYSSAYFNDIFKFGISLNGYQPVAALGELEKAYTQ